MSKVIREDIGQTTLETPNVRQKALAVRLQKAFDMDPQKAPAMIKMLSTDLFPPHSPLFLQLNRKLVVFGQTSSGTFFLSRWVLR